MLLKIIPIVYDTCLASQLSVEGEYVLLEPTLRNAFL